MSIKSLENPSPLLSSRPRKFGNSPPKPLSRTLKAPTMNRTKKLLIGLVTVAAMPAFADTKATTSSSGEERLEELFKADLQYRSDSQSDAVVVAEGRDGVYIGSGDGMVAGDRLR